MNGYSSMDINEDDDELLYEIDVKFHRTEQSIYLFQYPIRPYYKTYDETSFTNARIKEKYSIVEMDLLIDSESSNYYSSRGKQFADSTNNDNNGKHFFNSDRMDKQTIASTNSSDGNRKFLFKNIFAYYKSIDYRRANIETLEVTCLMSVLFVEITRLLMRFTCVYCEEY